MGNAGSSIIPTQMGGLRLGNAAKFCGVVSFIVPVLVRVELQGELPVSVDNKVEGSNQGGFSFTIGGETKGRGT